MIENIKTLMFKCRSVVMYAVFGILTTVVNFVSYAFCYNICKVPNVLSTMAAWGLAVGFAFVTNKLWVFDSKSFDLVTLKHEVPAFLGTRIATGILDVAIMYLTVDVLNQNPTAWKLMSNGIVIILNYGASKLLIFKK